MPLQEQFQNMSCNNGVSFFPANFILQNHHEDHEIHPQSLLPQDFNGLLGGKRSFNSITTCSGNVNGEEEFSFSEDLGEKKRRLNIEQVKTLEKSFEIGNKLDPERKLELARALGLQPRQIAIWFQNRRARWKTKQLEKDYDSLHRQIQTLKDQNQFLLTQNQKLLAQVRALKSGEAKESLNLNKETEGSCSENSSDEQITVVPAEINRELTGGYPPSSMTIGRRQFSTTTTMQFFEKSSLGENMVKEENSISNMLCGIDEQYGFWPWLDQQHYQ